MHLLYVMSDQKIMNQDYQDPATDIITAEQGRAKKAGAAPAYLSADANLKEQEVRSALSSAISAMSTQDAFEIVGHSLKALKLD
jgi:hypothetical protein